MAKTAVIGAGSWGTALAVHLAHVGHPVSLWARDPAFAARLAHAGTNDVYLPGVPLPAAITPSSSMEEALEGATLVVFAVPSHGCRMVVRSAAPLVGADTTIVSATKGLEGGSLLRMSQVIDEELQGRCPVVVLSGPSFASEVARQQPTAILAASTSSAAAAHVQAEFRAPHLRLYAASDVVGVELAGALKNVIAIAAGVVEGLGLGHNALAALITRGLAEIARLTEAAGGRRETPAGLSGLGDLVLTCTGSLSRNRQVGIELGHGRSLADVLAGMKMVAEGVNTTAAALALGERYGVELPITHQVGAVLAGKSDIRTAIGALMLRPQKKEMEAAG